ncbi:hypothetical protein [Gluconacetobacter tumulicola]|uniref:Uncharacterized protein n=1 Tax=Gluconacetobacter tumulicola TaxID=1017177 RepID=A0A7W4PBK2_9PROT|nr:hypothetical protein [Gluconacetobacter tumulicola]MBB2181230.1 hypothetical protein [Gluconacetobacter tumulicola]
MTSSIIDEGKFLQKLTFYDWEQAETEDGRGNTKQLTNPRYEYGELFDVNPFPVVNGVQENMRDFTSILRTRYRSDLNAFTYVSQQVRQPDRSVITVYYQVVRQMAVEQENRYLTCHLSKQTGAP